MTTLKETLQADVVKHLKARSTNELTTVRNVLGEIERKELAGKERVELSDVEVIAVLKKQAASRREVAANYESLGRPEDAAQEISEAVIIEAYLPAALTEADVEAIVVDAIAQTGAESMRQMGDVMKIVTPAVAGRFDGSAVAALVKAKLA